MILQSFNYALLFYSGFHVETMIMLTMLTVMVIMVMMTIDIETELIYYYMNMLSIELPFV